MECDCNDLPGFQQVKRSGDGRCHDTSDQGTDGMQVKSLFHMKLFSHYIFALIICRQLSNRNEGAYIIE